MFPELVQFLQRIFTVWALSIFTLCGAWLFFMVNPTMAQQGLMKEASLARWGGLAYLAVGIGLYLLLKILAFFF